MAITPRQVWSAIIKLPSLLFSTHLLVDCVQYFVSFRQDVLHALQQDKAFCHLWYPYREILGEGWMIRHFLAIGVQIKAMTVHLQSTPVSRLSSNGDPNLG